MSSSVIAPSHIILQRCHFLCVVLGRLFLIPSERAQFSNPAWQWGPRWFQDPITSIHFKRAYTALLYPDTAPCLRLHAGDLLPGSTWLLSAYSGRSALTDSYFWGFLLEKGKSLNPSPVEMNLRQQSLMTPPWLSTGHSGAEPQTQKKAFSISWCWLLSAAASQPSVFGLHGINDWFLKLLIELLMSVHGEKC